MARIFISYRRDDTAGHAAFFNHLLSQHFGQHDVFRDIDTLEPGVDFVEAIQREVSSCSLLIAIIGRQWLTVTDKAGRRRLDQPHDYVRLEIATALQRNIRVIPVLVHGAFMPPSDELPADLVPLSRRHAYELRDNSFVPDVQRLLPVIERVIDVATRAAGDSAPSSSPTADQKAQAEKLRQQANTAYNQGKRDQAFAKYTKAIKLDPTNAYAYNGRGNMYYAREQYDLALADYNRAIELDPSYVLAYYNRGSLYQDRQQYDLALADYNRAIELDPRDAVTYYNRGLLYKARKKPAAARADFQRAVELGYAPAKDQLKSR